MAIGVGLACSAISSVAAEAQEPRFASDGRRARLDWDYDGTRILGHVGNEVRIWDAQSGRLLRTFAGHQEEIRFVQFSPTGKLAVSSAYMLGKGELARFPEYWSKDNTVRLWDLENGTELWALDGQAAAGFSPDGGRLATLSLLRGSEYEVVMWDIAEKRALFRVRSDPPLSAYARLRFSSDGRYFLTVRNRDVLVYDAESGHEIRRMSMPRALSFSVYGRNGEIATYGYSGIEVWDFQASRLRRRIQLSTERAIWSQSEWTPDGKWVVGLGGDPDRKCQTAVWNVESATLIGTAECDHSSSFPVVSPDGSRFLLAWGGVHMGPGYIPPEAGLYELRTGRRLKVIENRTWDVVGFSPDSRTFLTYTYPLTVTIFSSESGEPLRRLDLSGTR